MDNVEWCAAWCDGFIAASALHTGSRHGREIYERMRDEYLKRRPVDPTPTDPREGEQK